MSVAFLENIAAITGIMIILAVSLNIINGITGMLSLGHYAFFGIGGYLGAFLTVQVHRWGLVNGATGIPLFFCIIMTSGLLACCAGLVISGPTLRLRGDYLAIATLGFNEIFKIIIENIDLLGGPKGYSIYSELGNRPPEFRSNLIWIYLFVIISIFVVHRIMKSVIGRNLLSIREDETAAESMGINTSKYKIIAFLIGSFLAGTAGILFVMYDKFYANPRDFGFLEGIPVLLMITMGGLGSTTGAVMGAVFLTVLLQFLKLVPGISSQPVLVYAALLILIMILRPTGIMNRKELSDLPLYGKIRDRLMPLLRKGAPRV